MTTERDNNFTLVVVMIAVLVVAAIILAVAR